MANERNTEKNNNNNYRKRNSNNRRNGYKPYKGNYNRNKQRAIETIDDVKKDIVRIEREIELEIREIRNVKLGL